MGKIDNKIFDVIITPLKKIENKKGSLFHIIRNFDPGYNGFGEVYISTINYQDIKAWKQHKIITSNIVVPRGKVKFVIADLREDSTTECIINEYILSIDNYVRLTIPPKLWYGFMGLSKETNMLINVADIPHDANEQINKEIDFIKYKW